MVVARRSAILNVMADAAEKAGRALVRDFGEVEHLQVSQKGPADFVSTADHKAEKIVMETLAKARPSYGFLMEEGGAKKGKESNVRWIIDPLDGTTNFLHGIPHWAVSIALEKDNEIIAGVVHNPINDETFYAEKGMGAFMTGRRLRVSNRTDLMQCVIAMGGARPGTKSHTVFMTEQDAVSPYCAGMRRFGAASLDICYVAAARVDGFWERDLSAWDVAAAALILKESGGTVTDLNGGKDYVYGRSIVVGNSTVHGQLLKKIKAVSGKEAPKVKSAT
ncbi:MAG TPA: inositol monophosphatase family protein [Patescibacteria group bacterium]|nr:inositol monophosphatase family protein [Patescibacteria group bacterium]